MRVFIFGAGYSGRAFARRIAGRAARVAGTTRRPEGFAALGRAGIVPLVFDGRSLAADTAAELGGASHLVVSAGPGEAGDPVLSVAREAIRAMPDLAWIGYLSTIGVYGDHAGAWVDEDSECRPTSRRTIGRLAVEGAWLALGEARGVPVAVLRLSGIYGPGRNALANLAEGSARRIIRPGQVFNRIHAGDIAGALEHLGRHRIGGIFNVSDDLPSPPQDVIEHAARLMGVEPPPAIAFEDAEMTPMARSFWGESKRVANARIKATGFAFEWPDYRVALSRMWAEGTWRLEA